MLASDENTVVGCKVEAKILTGGPNSYSPTPYPLRCRSTPPFNHPGCVDRWNRSYVADKLGDVSPCSRSLVDTLDGLARASIQTFARTLFTEECSLTSTAPGCCGPSSYFHVSKP